MLQGWARRQLRVPKTSADLLALFDATHLIEAAEPRELEQRHRPAGHDNAGAIPHQVIERRGGAEPGLSFDRGLEAMKAEVKPRRRVEAVNGHRRSSQTDAAVLRPCRRRERRYGL